MVADPSANEVCRRCGDFLQAPSAMGKCGTNQCGLCAACIEVLCSRRSSNLAGEKSLRRLSTTFYLLSALGCGAVLVGVGLLVNGNPHAGGVALTSGLTVAVPPAVVGWGLSRLRPWAVVPAVVLSAALLLLFPLGTIMGAEALVSLRRHRELTSDDYREVIASTAHLDEAEVARWHVVAIVVVLLATAAFFVWGLR